MNLTVAWARQVAAHPQKVAIYWGDDTFTHEWLYERAGAVAAELRRRGVQPGDRVGIWLKNCPEFLVALFAIFRAGAAAVPINNFFKPEEVQFMLADAGIRVLVSDASMAAGTAALQARQPGLEVWCVEGLGGLPPGAPAEQIQRGDGDLAVLIYTSGTTGQPKGAMLTHGNLLHNAASCQEVLQCVEEDRFILLLPMFHSFMLTVCVVLPMTIGSSIVLIRSVHPVKSILAEMARHRGTLLPAVPSFFRVLAQQPELPPDLALRLCVSGGAPLPIEILREFNRKFPLPLLEGYGLSETSPVASLNPIDGRWREGSIGLPIPGVEMSVQDEQGNLLAAGETGEVCVRGGNVMAGYWNQPEATAQAMRNGWLLTGDIGHYDADGYFYITDRKKDMLIVNGINVYPRQVEEVIYQFPGIREAAVIGVPDPRRGEHPVAFVAVQDGAKLDERALHAFLREHLADFKVPRRVTVLPALPRNSTGKILKTDLRQLATKSAHA